MYGKSKVVTLFASRNQLREEHRADEELKSHPNRLKLAHVANADWRWPVASIRLSHCINSSLLGTEYRIRSRRN